MISNAPFLQMQRIRKIFPGVAALDDVNFDLRRGEVHVLLGENGAGKSTLMKILSGAYQKTAGQIFLDGREVEIASPRQSQELGISIIYQELNLVPSLSAAENIFLGREPTRRAGIIDRKRLQGAAQRILDELGVNISAQTEVRKLGVAKQQMVEVAKALSLEARIIIMDEPTSALTEREIRELFAAIRRLKQQGVGIVYISHRLEELFEIGDRVTVMRDGRRIGVHDVSAATRSQLIHMMVARELTEQYPRQRAAKRSQVLRLENVSTASGLKSIRVSLYGGEILGIFGLLGSGRTQLARTIFGLTRIVSGQIFVKGAPANLRSARAAINQGIGYLTEDRKSEGLVLNLSVRENIALPGLPQFSRWGVVQRRREAAAAARMVAELKIKTPGLEQKVMYLSGGNQQKVVLSKWLCCQADVFIFDEPTRGIDVGAKVEIYQLMNRLTANGVAIVMISSELPEILGMSDRIVVMHQGRITGEFTREEADQETIMQRALGAAGVN